MRDLEAHYFSLACSHYANAQITRDTFLRVATRLNRLTEALNVDATIHGEPTLTEKDAF